MSDIDWAAGFFDGEGCVYLSKTFRAQHKLNFAQKERTLLDEVERILQCGGGVYKTGKDNGYYQLTYSGKKAVRVGVLLYPSLRHVDKVQKLALLLSDWDETLPTRLERSFEVPL